MIISQSPEHSCSEAQRLSQQERQAGRRQVSSLYTASFWHRCVRLSTRVDLLSPSALPADRDLQTHSWGDRLTPLYLPLCTLHLPSCSDTLGAPQGSFPQRQPAYPGLCGPPPGVTAEAPQPGSTTPTTFHLREEG